MQSDRKGCSALSGSALPSPPTSDERSSPRAAEGRRRLSMHHDVVIGARDAVITMHGTESAGTFPPCDQKDPKSVGGSPAQKESFTQLTLDHATFMKHTVTGQSNEQVREGEVFEADAALKAQGTRSAREGKAERDQGPHLGCFPRRWILRQSLVVGLELCVPTTSASQRATLRQSRDRPLTSPLPTALRRITNDLTPRSATLIHMPLPRFRHQRSQILLANRAEGQGAPLAVQALTKMILRFLGAEEDE